MSIRFIKALTDDPILAAASKMEPELRSAFLAAIERVKGEINLSALEAALRSGDVDRVVAILALDKKFAAALRGVGLEAGVSSLRDAMRSALAEGAAAALKELPKATSIETFFNLKNPRIPEILDQYSFKLIREITQDQVEMVRGVVQRAFAEGAHPFEQARTIKQSIGLTSTQERAVANYRRSLENGSRDALNRALRDKRYDRSVIRSIADQKPMSADQVDKLVGRYRERYLQYRARNIARTESVRASNAGQRELWRQAKEKGLLADNVLRRWVVSGDDATCDICSDLDGETAGLDEEFDDGIMEPPDPHPSCRCSVVLESSRD